jgi:hypothetical protein
MFVVEGFLSGARGTILVVLIASAIIVSQARRKLLAIGAFSTAAVLLVALTLVITRIRASHTYMQSDVSASEILASGKTTRGATSSDSQSGVEAIVERLTYHADALGRLMRLRAEEREPDPGRYAFGSVQDLRLLIPSRFGLSGDTSRFEDWMGLILEGNPMLLYPVGAAGEAYFIGSWAGLAIGAVYGIVFFISGLWLRQVRRNVISMGLYIQVLIPVFVLGTSALADNVPTTLKSLVVSVPLMFGIREIFRTAKTIRSHGRLALHEQNAGR